MSNVQSGLMLSWETDKRRNCKLNQFGEEAWLEYGYIRWNLMGTSTLFLPLILFLLLVCVQVLPGIGLGWGIEMVPVVIVIFWN